MKMTAFRDTAKCSFAEGDRHFRSALSAFDIILEDL
jgi:hypothetical protein